MGTLDQVLARIAGQRVYIDTNLFNYFLDAYERYLPVAAALLQAARQRRFLLSPAGPLSRKLWSIPIAGVTPK